MEWRVVDDLKQEFCRFEIKSGFWMSKFTLKARIKAHERNIDMHYKSRLPHILFEDLESVYKIVFHHSHRTSFYRDEIQFALMTKVGIFDSSGVEFVVLVDDDIDHSFILMVVYSILLVRYDDCDETSDMSVDFGFLGREFQPIDVSWHPKVKLL